jgi:hypothetical protein
MRMHLNQHNLQRSVLFVAEKQRNKRKLQRSDLFVGKKTKKAKSPRGG